MARPKKSEQVAEKKKMEFISPEQLEANADERRSRLKTLIVLGKERGYLTYAEINDHLPDDVQNSEQIDGIIGMINDMGIQVYEEAPDAEVLLMSDAPPAVTDEDAVEEAEQALATVDSDFGRTTDPVRMYMREMGTVDLLTRESEIEISNAPSKAKCTAIASPPAFQESSFSYALIMYFIVLEPTKAQLYRLCFA